MIKRRAARSRRSAREWAARSLLCAVALIAGYVAVTRTLAMVVRGDNIRLAQALATGDGRLTALLAASLSGAEASRADRAKADRLARNALRRDATAATAASALGINAQLRGDTPGARRLFAYAETLSRRDIYTQLWAIEDAVGRQDVPATLHHYDIALRTSREMPALLFPVLGSAISEPAVRRSLIATLSLRPNWGNLFIEYVAANGNDPRATSLLFRGLRDAGIRVAPLPQMLLINTLAARGAFEDAWSYYASVYPEADRHLSRDPLFTANISNPTVFDWTPANDNGLVATITAAGGGGTVEFSAPASVGGLLLKQVEMLSPGNYRFEGRSAGIEQPPESSPFWVISCADGRELGRIEIPSADRKDGELHGRFSVPAGCPVQILALMARPSTAASGVSGQISRAMIRPS